MIQGAGSSKPRGPRATQARAARRPLHGVLLLDKPHGWTSQDALAKVKGLFRAQKAGHTGTLDPLATGLLPICFGAATKFSNAGLEADKAYRATCTLGQTRVGGDLEGEIIEEREPAFDRATLDAVIARFTGTIDQVPPMHSALKHEGRALYELARAGIEVEREPRRVQIHRLDIVSWHERELVLDITCSKGTYIRTLAEDIGRALGCGAHLAGLRRTGSGTLRVDRAVTIEQLEKMTETERDALLLGPDALVAALPAVQLAADDAGRFLAGMRRRVALADAAAVRVYGSAPQAFLGCAHITAGELIADRLLSPAEVQATP